MNADAARVGGNRPDPPEIDFEGALWDCIAHLQALIRMDTVNPPGREIGLARYLDDVLRGAGIDTTLFEPSPGRAALVARIPGSGRARPLLLLAHMDVVGIEREHWKTNPFGGEIVDGHLYGRGAIDDKGMLATNLQAMLLVQQHIVRAGRRLDRDLVFVATSDEETGGPFGIDWLVTNHPGALAAEFALNEGGRIRRQGERLSYAAVQCAEKVPHTLRLVAHGRPGHASVPIPDNAVVRLARAIDAVARHMEPVDLTDITRRFFRELGAFWENADERGAMLDIASGDTARLATGAEALATVPHYNAVLRNGISPTMLAGGVRSNVIPAEVSATLNVRTIPGASIDDLVARLVTAINDPGVDVIVASRGHDAPQSPVDSPMFSAIQDAMAALAPGVPTLPFLSTGATDGAALRRLGVHVYGLLPFPLTQDDEERMHAHDERVPVQSLSFAVRLTWEIVTRLGSAV